MRWSHGLSVLKRTTIFCKKDGGAFPAGTAAFLLAAWAIYLSKFVSSGGFQVADLVVSFPVRCMCSAREQTLGDAFWLFARSYVH